MFFFFLVGSADTTMEQRGTEWETVLVSEEAQPVLLQKRTVSADIVSARCDSPSSLLAPQFG
jgi:hypothetical protein